MNDRRRHRPGECSVCLHPDRAAIEADLAAHADTYATIVDRYALTDAHASRKAAIVTLGRHRRQHTTLGPHIKCAVCLRPDRTDIDIALLADTPAAEVARMTGIPYAGIIRHRTVHLGWDPPGVPNGTCVVCAHPDLDRITDDRARGYPPHAVARVHNLRGRDITRHEGHMATIAARAASRLGAVAKYLDDT